MKCAGGRCKDAPVPGTRFCLPCQIKLNAIREKFQASERAFKQGPDALK